MESHRHHPDLRRLLSYVDTHELVLPGRDAGIDLRERDELFAIWSAARAEANAAYDDWAAQPGAPSYAAYRAAEDRADAAQDALAVASDRVAPAYCAAA